MYKILCYSDIHSKLFVRNTCTFPPAESQDAKWFPVEDSSSPNFSINYFISKLNFDAISGKIVTGAA